MTPTERLPWVCPQWGIRMLRPDGCATRLRKARTFYKDEKAFSFDQCTGCAGPRRGGEGDAVS